MRNYTGDDVITTLAIPSLIIILGAPAMAITAWQTGEPLWWLGVAGTVYGSLSSGLVRWLLTVRRKAIEAPHVPGSNGE